MLPIAILVLISARILTDIIYAGPKPSIIVVGYTIFALILSTALLAKSRNIQGRKTIAFIFFIASALFASTLYSDTGFAEHAIFSFQVLVPIIFLLACTATPSTLKKTGEMFRRFIAAPALILIFVFLIYDYRLNNIYGLGIFDYYANNPNHVSAQTVLKISLIFLESTLLGACIFGFLFFMNVRSTILSYILAFAFFNKIKLFKKSSVKKIFLIMVPATIALIILIDPGAMLERLLFKGREAGFSGGISNVSSGRTEIYSYYINYILNNFTLVDWLFGRGPIWLSSHEQQLSAHNDVLNIVISFGLLGLFAVASAYYIFFSSLPATIKTPAAMAFVVLFITNGVVFHQSNVLFALLYLFSMPEHKFSRIDNKGEELC